jgi:hypothetical protein
MKNFVLLIFLVYLASCSRSIVDTDLKLGDGTDVDVTLEAELGKGVSNPSLFYNATDDVWEICNEGVPCLPIADTDIFIKDITVHSDFLIGSPTGIDSLKEVSNSAWSAGIVSGFGLTDNGDGTIDLAAGEALIRDSASATADLYSAAVGAQAGITLTDESGNFVYLDYNAGSPQFVVSTADTAHNGQDRILAYYISRVGNDLYIVDTRGDGTDHPAKANRRELEIAKFKRAEGGSMIGDNSDLSLLVTAGAFYYINTEMSHVGFDTSVAGTANANVFTYYYQDGAGGWTVVEDQKDIDSSNYDDGDGTLASVDQGVFSTTYKVDWVYVIHGNPSKLGVVYGQAQGSLAVIQDRDPPTSVPPEIENSGSLIGRIIVEEDDTSFTLVESTFGSNFSSSTVGSHNDLAGLQGGDTAEYFHLDNTDYTSLTDANAQLDAIQTDGSPSFAGLAVTAGSFVIAPDPEFNSTGYMGLPTGTDAQRPGSPSIFDFRGNTDQGCIEYYTGSAWACVGSGDGGGIPLMGKGSLYTSNGSTNGEWTACADGEILEWDAAEVAGIKCVNNLADDKYSATEVAWGTYDGAALFRRCLTVGSDITVTGNITTWDSALNPIHIANYSGTLWNVHIVGANGTDYAIISYDDSDGTVDAEIGGSYKIGAGSKFCMEYTK